MTEIDPDITFLSEAKPVNMADDWFNHISPEHFWIKRRATIIDYLYKEIATPAPRWLDVGCGTGLFQTYLRNKHGITAFGVDLNVAALRQNKSGSTHTICYDINDKDPSIKESFDIISVLDVIEHIEDEHQFLTSLLFHLRPGGYLIGNVPAFNCFFSKYDKIAGHQRRYSFRNLCHLANEPPGLAIEAWTYWGFPLLPLLILRNFITNFTPEKSVIETGFSVRSAVTNTLLQHLSGFEILPNHFLGTSLAFVLRKGGKPNC